MKFVEIKPNVKKVSFLYLLLFIILAGFFTIFLIPIYQNFFIGEAINALVLILVILLFLLIFFFKKIAEAYSLSVILEDKFVEKKVGIFRVKKIRMPIKRIEAYTVQKNFVDFLLGLESLQITSSNPSQREDIIINNVEPEFLSGFLTLLDGLIKKSK